MLPIKYDNLEKINKEIDKHAEPLYNYITSFKVKVISVTVSPEYYDTLLFLMQQKQWEQYILNRTLSLEIPSYLAFSGPHGLVEIKRKVL